MPGSGENLKTRLVTAAIGIPVLLGASYLGSIYWQLVVMLLTGIALFEYLKMMEQKELHPIFIPAYAMMLSFLFAQQLGQLQTGAVFLSLVLMVLLMVIRYPFYSHYDLALSLFGAFYCGFLFSYGLQLSNSHSFVVLWYILILTWASDVGGFMFGSIWGRKRLVPLLSPKKTWEGAIGGVVFSILVSLAAYYGGIIVGIKLDEAILLGLMGSLAAQLGDLLESSIKRFFGVKDSGTIIPGHGGVLDRFDSFMLVLPTVYYLLQVYGL